MNVCQITLGAF